MDIKNLMKFGPLAKAPATPAAAPVANPGANPFAATAKQAPQKDALGMLQAQLQKGEVKFNPDKPALPHFASKSWIA